MSLVLLILHPATQCLPLLLLNSNGPIPFAVKVEEAVLDVVWMIVDMCMLWDSISN